MFWIDEDSVWHNGERLFISKHDQDGNFIWWRYYKEEGWSVDRSEFRHIVEVREDILAIFGYVGYADDPDMSREGLWVALVDTSGEILTQMHIRGDWIDRASKFGQILQVGPNRFLALIRSHNRILSIRFDLDPPDAAVMENEALPSAFTLSSPYPNPFNSSTRLDYTLPTAGRVSLRLYDLAGRVVMDLVDKVDTGGRHSVMLDGASLAAGVYVVVLKGEGCLRKEKLLLIR